ncbi:DUF4260 domain-containing protein [Niveispirillum sp. BGYR6]|uniref:DUF4260 domain-containing protein n=1 Tax=Niveispirillum sp. BGYR6 TaxID=2971249 RepID=UPI0022B97D9F|nr:DUF4260 domain-containing protein [Niveispirillum sp. BGYR6]MDG5496285.1 DUF4260 domain-containing protein [Niveispirillum sp. BGYR6]
MPGMVNGTPKALLHLEALGLFAATLWAYGHQGGNWGLFAVLFLLPDLSMLGYLAGPKAGARLYNLFHAYLLPAAGLAWGLGAGWDWASHLALIWIAHIALDRALGFGLKYEQGFRFSHLGGGLLSPRPTPSPAETVLPDS